MHRHDNDDGESTPLLLGDDRNRKTTVTFYNNQFINHKPSPAKPIAYPHAVYFVLLSKFFESFAANGVRSVLALYLRDSLHYAEDFSTAVLHIFNFFGQFCPIFGAVLADSYIGNVSTIFHFMFVYAAGWIGMVVVTLLEPGVKHFLPLLFGSLVLCAIGNGSIRACISALGGCQFQLPEQQDALQRYFSQYYFIYYGGILLSKIVPPSVRVHTQCLGRNDCYAAVFGMLAVVFFVCWLLFLCGMPYYRAEPSLVKENIVAKVSGCVWRGARRRVAHGKHSSNGRRWIDGAIGPYSEEFVDDVWDYLKVVLLFAPLPVYFALLVQQDSTWTFQATQLDTRVFGFRIEPDQAKAVGPVIMLMMIPVWENGCVPLLKRCGGIVITPLRSITLGGLCAAMAFACAAILQLNIENYAYVVVDVPDDLNTAVDLLDALATNETVTIPIVLIGKPTTSITEISILWQIPQFFLLMMGEVLLSIPGLQFAFTEAPASMKSVLAATWFLNNATGNLIVVALTELHWFTRPSSVFLVYTLMMLASMLVFVALASNYEYRADRQRRKSLENGSATDKT